MKLSASDRAVIKHILQTTGGTVKRVGDYLSTDEQAFERFAWLPTRTASGKRVWLCKYIEVRHYVQWKHQPYLEQAYTSARFTKQDYLLYTLKQGSETIHDYPTQFVSTPEYDHARNKQTKWAETARRAMSGLNH